MDVRWITFIKILLLENLVQVDLSPTPSVETQPLSQKDTRPLQGLWTADFVILNSKTSKNTVSSSTSLKHFLKLLNSQMDCLVEPDLSMEGLACLTRIASGSNHQEFLLSTENKYFMPNFASDNQRFLLPTQQFPLSLTLSVNLESTPLVSLVDNQEPSLSTSLVDDLESSLFTSQVDGLRSTELVSLVGDQGSSIFTSQLDDLESALFISQMDNPQFLLSTSQVEGLKSTEFVSLVGDQGSSIFASQMDNPQSLLSSPLVDDLESTLTSLSDNLESLLSTSLVKDLEPSLSSSLVDNLESRLPSTLVDNQEPSLSTSWINQEISLSVSLVDDLESALFVSLVGDQGSSIFTSQFDDLESALFTSQMDNPQFLLSTSQVEGLKSTEFVSLVGDQGSSIFTSQMDNPQSSLSVSQVDDFEYLLSSPLVDDLESTLTSLSDDLESSLSTSLVKDLEPSLTSSLVDNLESRLPSTLVDNQEPSLSTSWINQAISLSVSLVDDLESSLFTSQVDGLRSTEFVSLVGDQGSSIFTSQMDDLESSLFTSQMDNPQSSLSISQVDDFESLLSSPLVDDLGSTLTSLSDDLESSLTTSLVKDLEPSLTSSLVDNLESRLTSTLVDDQGSLWTSLVDNFESSMSMSLMKDLESSQPNPTSQMLCFSSTLSDTLPWSSSRSCNICGFISTGYSLSYGTRFTGQSYTSAPVLKTSSGVMTSSVQLSSGSASSSVNLPPEVFQSLPSLTVTVGSLFQFTVPPGTFLDPEDGAAVSLVMQLVYRPLTHGGSWLSLKGHTLHGVPLEWDLRFSPQVVLLAAQDLQGLQSSWLPLVFHIHLQSHVPCHTFTLTVDRSLHSVLLHRQQVELFMRKLSAFFESSIHHLSLISLTPGSVVVTWYNHSLCEMRGTLCPVAEVQRLWSAMISTNGSISAEFRDSMLPEFPVSNIAPVHFRHDCLTPTTGQPISTACGTSAPPRPTAYQQFLGLITALLVTCLIILILLLVLVVLHCHRSSACCPGDRLETVRSQDLGPRIPPELVAQQSLWLQFLQEPDAAPSVTDKRQTTFPRSPYRL